MLGAVLLLAASGVKGLSHAARQRRGECSRVAIVASQATSVALGRRGRKFNSRGERDRAVC